MSILAAAACLLALLVSLCLCYVGMTRRQQLPLPPGPPADPLIGHIRTMPTKNQEVKLYEWSKIYGMSRVTEEIHGSRLAGDVMHLNILGNSIIVLSSQEAASELLGKRRDNYSDRPAINPILRA